MGIRAKIWRCDNCNGRVKGLGILIEQPKKCPHCGGEKMIASTSR